MNIAMDEVVSSNLHSVGYDPARKILAVRFKSFPNAKLGLDALPTSLYNYDHVPPDVHKAIVDGAIEGSVTKTFNTMVKNHPTTYPFTKIEATPGVPLIPIGATDV